MKLPAAPLAERPAADAPAGVPLPGGPPGDLFAAILNIQTARTAPAEGQTTDTPDAPAAPATAQPADASVLSELAAALPAPAPVSAGPQTPATPAMPAAKAQPPHRAESHRAQPAARAVPAKPAMPAKPDSPELAQPEDATAAKPAKPDRPAKAATPATPAIPAVPAKPKAPAAKPQPISDAPPPAVKPAATPKDAPAPAAKDGAPAPAPRAEPVAAAPAEDHPSVHAPAEPRPVLRGERIEALVRVATRHGAAEARMELHPQELGSVVVRLRVTSEGLQATFTASNADAIPQLQQAGEDLRRSLEAKGLTLASLDVRGQSGEAGERREPRGWGRSRDRRPVAELDDETTTSITTTLPAGALVDVHA